MKGHFPMWQDMNDFLFNMWLLSSHGAGISEKVTFYTTVELFFMADVVLVYPEV